MEDLVEQAAVFATGTVWPAAQSALTPIYETLAGLPVSGHILTWMEARTPVEAALICVLAVAYVHAKRSLRKARTEARDAHLKSHLSWISQRRARAEARAGANRTPAGIVMAPRPESGHAAPTPRRPINAPSGSAPISPRRATKVEPRSGRPTRPGATLGQRLTLVAGPSAPGS